MRMPRSTLPLLFAAPLALSACNSGTTAASNSVAMRDMEVVDGTVSDGMTDLDAAKVDGTAMEQTAGNNAAEARPAVNAAAAKDSEVVADD